jgi:hypothetical protein
VPGEQIVCACPGSSVTGAQVCNALGTGYETCEGCSDSSGNGAGGAGSANSGSGGSTSMTSAGNGGGATAASSATGGTGCDSGDCDTCSLSMCAEQVCATQIAACQADTDCTDLVACFANCPVNDIDCYMGCDTMHISGAVLYGEAEFCKNCTACSVDCKRICPS